MMVQVHRSAINVEYRVAVNRRPVRQYTASRSLCRRSVVIESDFLTAGAGFASPHL
jgi:hypothetical protein